MRFLTLITAIALITSSAMAVSVTVAPTTGVGGTAVTNTILDAIAQINAGADATNTITLRSTEGPIVLTDDETWTIAAGKSIDWVAETGQPIVVINNLTGGTDFLNIVADAASAENFSMTGIAFIPEVGIPYLTTNADGIHITGGNWTFTDCVFSANDGSNGVYSQNAENAFGVNNVGDDWLELYAPTGDVTLSNCAISGCWDDAILFDDGSLAAAGSHTLTLDQGTVIANVGGAGIQVFGDNSALVLDGSAGRVQIAECGLRPGNDTWIKYFWDVGCSIDIDQADLMTCTNGGIFDFEGVPTISITNSRVAFANSDDTGDAANIAIYDASSDSAYASTITLDNVTVHDAQGSTNPEGIAVFDGATQPTPTWNITDSIFSGAGDTFDLLNGVLGTVNISTSAVVTSGPDAVGSVGDLGAQTVFNDPIYVSYAYTVGRSQNNPDFLLPQNPAYAGAASGGADLVGGATGTFVSVPVELSVFSSN